jgi:hypothetical protein
MKNKKNSSAILYYSPWKLLCFIFTAAAHLSEDEQLGKGANPRKSEAFKCVKKCEEAFHETFKCMEDKYHEYMLIQKLHVLLGPIYKDFIESGNDARANSQINAQKLQLKKLLNINAAKMARLKVNILDRQSYTTKELTNKKVSGLLGIGPRTLARRKPVSKWGSKMNTSIQSALPHFLRQFGYKQSTIKKAIRVLGKPNASRSAMFEFGFFGE